MSNEKLLNEDGLEKLWQRCLETFMMRPNTNAADLEFLNTEYNKTKNIWNGLLAIATISSTGVIQTDTNNEFDIVIAPVESGKKYSSNYGGVYAFYSSYPTINSQSYNSTRYVTSFTNITAPINGYVAIRVDKGTRNIVINEGSTALSFNQSYGAVIHKGDIEPVLLWENPNPTSDFYADISANTSNFNYFIIGYKPDKLSGTGVQYLKCKKEVGKNYYISVSEASSTSNTIYRRSFTISNDTKITVSHGYIDMSANDAAIIPIVIYGAKVL